MKYSEIIEIEPFFDSTFNMTEEKENYWKQFITNEKFESNLKEIVNAFTSLTGINTSLSGYRVRMVQERAIQQL